MSDGDHLQPIESAIDDEGLFFTRDNDDEALRITFKSEGDRYFIVGYRDDPNFVMIGSGWALPDGIEPLLSPKDTDAPSLAEAVDAGLLPTYEACQAYRRSLTGERP